MPYWLDGNNLTGQTVAEAREDRQTRRAFLLEIGGLAKSRGGHFVVYFDGDDHHRTAVPRGVQVRFSAPRSTDDVILERLQGVRTPSEVIVVTNDRTLSRRCRDAGAKTMDWQDFVSKVRRKGGKGNTSQDTKEEEVNVEEWVRYFGFDKNKNSTEFHK